MNFSPNNTNVAKAYVQARKAIKNIVKDKRNEQFRNSYVTLDNILEAVVPILLENDCVLMQELLGDAEKDNSVGVKTTILHSSGEWITCDEPLWFIASWDSKGPNKAQVVGIWITYLRRYAVAAFLGIPSDEDTDGNATSQATQNKQATGQNKGTTYQATKATTVATERLFADGTPLPNNSVVGTYDLFVKANSRKPANKVELQTWHINQQKQPAK